MPRRHALALLHTALPTPRVPARLVLAALVVLTPLARMPGAAGSSAVATIASAQSVPRDMTAHHPTASRAVALLSPVPPNDATTFT